MMRRSIGTFSTVLAVVLAVGAAQACDKHGKAAAKTGDGVVAKKGGCGSHGATTAGDQAPCSKKCAKKTATLVKDDADGHGGCPVEKKVQTVLASLPSMKYRVGDDTTCCSKSASEMAEKTGKPLQYVVGDQTYGSEEEAMAALTKSLEKEAESMASMQFAAGGKCYGCPMSAKDAAKKAGGKVVYRVGGVDFEDKAKAESAVKLVSEKVASLKMSYKVGDSSFCCDKMAGSAAKKAGKKMLYVVDGEETPCAKTAQLKLVQAKIRTIIETAASL